MFNYIYIVYIHFKVFLRKIGIEPMLTNYESAVLTNYTISFPFWGPGFEPKLTGHEPAVLPITPPLSF